MNRCDVCKNIDRCVCVPYGCECFEIDLEKHDTETYNQALEDFEMKIKKCCSLAGSCDFDDMAEIKEQLIKKQTFKGAEKYE